MAAAPVRPPLRPAPVHAVSRPLARFLAVEAASGVVLVLCTVAALVLANSPLHDAYHHFWEDTKFGVELGAFRLVENLHFWVNDLLMAVFFFVVGLEIKRELVSGELSSPRKAALPAIAAVGGMVVPAGVYLLLQYGKPGERGWGVPMATDIAFVVGVLAVFGKRVPSGLKVFLLSLAIVDDLGAILVIAVAYAGSPSWVALATAFGLLALIVALLRLGVRTLVVYVPLAVGVWYAVLQSGVHPTIAGVALGMVTPATAWLTPATLKKEMAELLARSKEADPLEPADLDELTFAARESVPPLDRFIHALHHWVGFGIMPLFALANAGVAIEPKAFADPIAVAVAAGLVIGKPVGIFLASWLAVICGVAARPDGVTWRMLFAAGCLGGIGFTMSLFVAGLAFVEPANLDAGKCGILAGSLVSAILGSVLLATARPATAPTSPEAHP